eukprot:496229_1
MNYHSTHSNIHHHDPSYVDDVDHLSVYVVYLTDRGLYPKAHMILFDISNVMHGVLCDPICNCVLCVDMQRFHLRQYTMTTINESKSIIPSQKFNSAFFITT